MKIFNYASAVWALYLLAFSREDKLEAVGALAKKADVLAIKNEGATSLIIYDMERLESQRTFIQWIFVNV